MAITATVTGVTGPGSAVTAQTFTNVGSFTISAVNAEILTLTFLDGRPDLAISISAATTITCTVSGANYTLTIS